MSKSLLHSLRLETVAGVDLVEHVDKLGQLRIRVFRDWPYLYEGDLDYERKYLAIYTDNKKAMAGLLFDNNTLVGATTAIPMELEDKAFQKPMADMGLSSKDVMYFGESILLPQYRGQGWGQKFMDLRLDFATSEKRSWAAFCAVDREPTHQLRPKDYRPLNEFWKKNGFNAIENAFAVFRWKDLGQKQETEKRLQFWTKKLGDL